MAVITHGPVSSYIVYTYVLSVSHELSTALHIKSNQISCPAMASCSPNTNMREDSRTDSTATLNGDHRPLEGSSLTGMHL